jgi:hypothetical protein
MSKSSKILSGILAFIPLVLWLVYIAMFVSFMIDTVANNLESISSPTAGPEFFVAFFSRMFGVLILLGLISMVKLIYFLVHITNNQKLDSNERLTWVLVGIFVGTFGFPVYWYLKIWKEEPTVISELSPKP